jgi:hypothetical protein
MLTKHLVSLEKSILVDKRLKEIKNNFLINELKEKIIDDIKEQKYMDKENLGIVKIHIDNQGRDLPTKFIADKIKIQGKNIQGIPVFL